MYPGRFWIALGSGENINEHITGERWPTKAERNKRLKQSVECMRALWAGETVTFHGAINIEEARLYTLPKQPPLIIGAAVTAETAVWMASWVDGVITVNQPYAKQKQFVEAFRSAGGEGKPMYLQAKHAFAADEESARWGAYEQWKTNIFKSSVLADLKIPEQFEAIAKFVKPEDLDKHVRISADPQKHIEWLQQDIELGFERIYIHNVNREQQRFIDVFGSQVLPKLV
jgi:coenzyme F420-dependent glucose-6-phosphate dehydrogenase